MSHKGFIFAALARLTLAIPDAGAAQCAAESGVRRVASFVQNEHTGEVLQTLALPACR